ncbi:PREDICTED: ubiquitin carboxyl-terminal hydrolase 47-like [Amphimedon queenslandica]|uniref:Ubiquitin carboxyl-terminal hydrolase 47 C-terminal domain-containing protein n=1 Tax=Amphimedon queenslandica TaxID=400682 RepID=A0AAN0JY67_AMPQE|nr:PREDICTED: ubiquitin carboxyl-terminal hydrolase 47-like [Amphimedon queenslandica]|eukprot:XP_019862150.1 PREDICTED: ubiquitin carboxyl-terminal hydrolase 47-like [Amphimedon queenslandica]
MELVPLIGIPPAGFRVYEIRNDEEYEMERLNERLMDIISEPKLIVRLPQLDRARIKLYLLQVNNTDLSKYMMESIVAKDTLVREFKKQIIEEAKARRIDCVLELDKMRLRDKLLVYPGSVYLDYQVIDTSMETYYVEPLKGPEKKKHKGQIQLSELSGVPTEYIYCAKYGLSLFPVEMSCLDIENKLIWYSITSDRSSLALYDDGRVIYYKY